MCQSCVPRGNQLKIYSAPTIARLYDLRVRLSVERSGYLIYETFAQGNQRFGKPTNPEFLLRSGELLELVRGVLTVVSYEDIIVTKPKPAKIQRICALREHT